jgi:glycerophosphoryl diester phosphodiesterase
MEMKRFFSPEPVIITTGGGGPGLFHDTINNMRHAISAGSDVIRTNISRTKDNKLVAFSNAIYQNKTMTGSGISSFTLDELRSFFRDAADTMKSKAGGEDINGIFPELEEVLSAFKNQRFNLHLSEKDPELVQQFCSAIVNLNADERILVSSLTGYNLKKIRSALPDIPTGFSFNGIVGFYALHRSGLIYFRKKFRDDAIITHEMIGASFLASAGLIEEAKSRDIRLYVLNVMKEDQVKRLSEAGVNGFVTNYASMVRRALPIRSEKA